MLCELLSQLCDFGLAKLDNLQQARFASASTRPDTTYPWMAPELIQSNGVSAHHTAAADIYSMGMVIYEVITGQVPFAGVDIADLKNALTGEPPLTLEVPRFDRSIAPGADALVQLMRQCSVRDPSQRPDNERVVL